MKVLNATVVLASALAFSSAFAYESAPSQQQPSSASSTEASTNSQTTIQKDSKGVIKRKKSTVEEKQIQQPVSPESQLPAEGR
jgi:hypothetical protein